MVYYSELKGRPVYDSNKKKLGVLSDLVFVDGLEYAEVTHLLYSDEEKYNRKIRFSLVEEFKEEKNRRKGEIVIKLSQPAEKINPFFLKNEELLVGEIVDKQVVDVSGAKIVRVNDVLLGKVGSKFCVVAVAVGKRSFMARLGASSLVNSLPVKLKEHIIRWESVESLEPKLHDIHLKIQKNKITDLHPEDIADVMEDMSHKERVLIFKTLDKDVAAQTLIGAEPEVTQSVFKSLKIGRIRDLLEDIPPDQAADIISLMDSAERDGLLTAMRPGRAGEIRKILGYHPESAGALMDTEFIAVPGTNTAQETIDLLRKLAPSSDKIYHLYVVDKQDKLLGVLSIRRLITAPPEKKVSDLMKKEVIHVNLATSKEDIAKTITRYDIFVLPVVDENSVIKGVVTADDVLTEVMPEEWRRERFKPLKTSRMKNART